MRMPFTWSWHRGDRREDIFVDDVDRQDFLKTLADACQKSSRVVTGCQDQLFGPKLGPKRRVAKGTLRQ